MLFGLVTGSQRLGAFGMAFVAVCALALLVTTQPVQGVDDGVVEGRIRLYTSVTQDTVDAVLAVMAEEQPGLSVEVFRAPTGELDARIAAELRTGGLTADVLWMTDPLSLQRYEADGLLAALPPDGLEAVPEVYRSEAFVGTRLLNLVIVSAIDLATPPQAWASLTDPSLDGGVVLPDPGFAGSAFAALGYLASTADLGMQFYQRLKDNGAVQVASPGEVVSGVAEGRYDAGITLDSLARSAIDKGAPLRLIWPEPGAIAVYSPAAVTSASQDPAAATAFLVFLVSPSAQAAIAATGWEPIRADVAWPYRGPTVEPDWPALFGRQEALLAEYRAIFGD